MVARGLISENFERILNEDSMPSSTKTLFGSFGKIRSSLALCRISQKEEQIIYCKSAGSTVYSAVQWNRILGHWTLGQW